jgi:uncharacterized protein
MILKIALSVLCAAVVVSASPAPPQAAAPDLESLARSLTEQLAARQFDQITAHFDETMTTAMPSAKLSKFWDGLIGQVGAFQSIAGTRVRPTESHPDYQAVLVTSKFEKATLNLKWVFNPKSRVAGFFVLPVEPDAQTTPDLDSLAKDLTQHLAARQFDPIVTHFDEAMTSAMPSAKLSEFWNGLIGQVGAFQSITGTRQQTVQVYQVVLVTTKFEKATLDVKWVFDSKARVAGFFVVPSQPQVPWAAPDYAKPSAFQERQVTVGTAPWQLPGTLTVPNGAGPFPAVVLVHGSGPNDEDETLGPNKPFKDIAWGLGSKGIAVLRYDKRTHKYAGELKKNLAGMTVKEEVTDDARAAVTLLATQQGVDKNRIYVLGHSLGATLAPRIAEGDDQVAGIIVMAGITRPLGQTVVDQVKYLAALSGPANDATQKQIEAAEKFAHDYESPTLKPDDTLSLMGAPVPGSYALDLRAYDPAATAARLRIPILVLQGEGDYQVTVKDDFAGWKKALANHHNVTMKSYPGLSHLFMPAGNPPSPADYQKADHVSVSAIDDIAAWIEAQHGGSK